MRTVARNSSDARDQKQGGAGTDGDGGGGDEDLVGAERVDGRSSAQHAQRDGQGRAERVQRVDAGQSIVGNVGLNRSLPSDPELLDADVG